MLSSAAPSTTSWLRPEWRSHGPGFCTCRIAAPVSRHPSLIRAGYVGGNKPSSHHRGPRRWLKALKKSSRLTGRGSLRCFPRCVSVKNISAARFSARAEERMPVRTGIPSAARLSLRNEQATRQGILHVQNRYANASASGVSPSVGSSVSTFAGQARPGRNH